jgi:hypothetical protein
MKKDSYRSRNLAQAGAFLDRFSMAAEMPAAFY